MSPSISNIALLAAWNAWNQEAFGRMVKPAKSLDRMDTTTHEVLMSDKDYLDALQAAIDAYEAAKREEQR
jgi:hypothetical protein